MYYRHIFFVNSKISLIKDYLSYIKSQYLLVTLKDGVETLFPGLKQFNIYRLLMLFSLLKHIKVSLVSKSECQMRGGPPTNLHPPPYKVSCWHNLLVNNWDIMHFEFSKICNHSAFSVRNNCFTETHTPHELYLDRLSRDSVPARHVLHFHEGFFDCHLTSACWI